MQPYPFLVKNSQSKLPKLEIVFLFVSLLVIFLSNLLFQFWLKFITKKLKEISQIKKSYFQEYVLLFYNQHFLLIINYINPKVFYYVKINFQSKVTFVPK